MRCRIRVEISIHATLFPGHLGRFRLRGCHPVSLPIPGRFIYSSRGVVRHHISHRFPGGIQLDLFRFHSPLIPESLLLSFPTCTRMLRLQAFSFRFPKVERNTMPCCSIAGSPIRRSADLRFHAPSRRISELVPSFFDFRAKASHGYLNAYRVTASFRFGGERRQPHTLGCSEQVG